MAPLQLKIKALGSQSATDVEIEDTESMETLQIIIFSQLPELGEDLRMCYQGKLVKDMDATVGSLLKNGDVLAVVPAPKKKATADEADLAALSADPAAAPPAAVEAAAVVAQAAAAPVESATAEPVPAPALAAPAQAAEPVDASETSPKFQPPPRNSDGEREQKSPRLDAASAPTENESAAVLTEEPALETAPPLVIPTPGTPSKREPTVDGSSSASLLTFANQLENDTCDMPPPEKLAAILREAATRMEQLEGASKEFMQALHVCNMFSAQGLRGGMAAMGGEPGEAGEMTPGSPSALDRQNSSDSQRSFMIKKGDSDLQEQHAKASAVSYQGTTGQTSSSSVSKEDMDKQRQARLQRLEKQQSEKQKEKDEADAKYRAREAMFTRRDDPAKPGTGKPSQLP